MKKVVLVILITVVLCLSGCGRKKSLTSVYLRSNDSEREDLAEMQEYLSADENDVNTWSIPLNNRFVPISSYVINDGTLSGIVIREFVDLETGVMWVLVDDSFEVIVDSEGKPCIYDGLEKLKYKYTE